MSTGSYWRNRAAPIIAGVIAAVGTDDATALRKALHDAYPFGERSMHPYKIWRDEIRRQLAGQQHRRPARADPSSPGQLTLFQVDRSGNPF